jgi:hypothetical protein
MFGVDCRASQKPDIYKDGFMRISTQCFACKQLELPPASNGACPFGIGIAPFIPENCPTKSTCTACPEKLKEKGESAK